MGVRMANCPACGLQEIFGKAVSSGQEHPLAYGGKKTGEFFCPRCKVRLRAIYPVNQGGYYEAELIGPGIQGERP